ncbi:MAG: DNA recombination-dependent growth factor C [uncultured Thiotrichaceae bacterium]|uniref:Recombination-associated protein RdgC n=1 Tax=uncultured Thiotrichaceae bacterium TaxID=298394 RepID=A0A6S6TRA4_9GAMM|nr:MAG: DNA recombination-dependent growth factor C [uncultured Thiotrichaceae bacterium]
MWFKNLYFFTLDDDFSLDVDALDEALAEKSFKPCGATQRESMGWAPPLGKNTDAFVHAVSGYLLISLMRQERILPSSVVREALEEKVEQIQVDEDRKVSGKEKKDLREAIEFELLPRAFTRTSQMDAWIDLKGNRLVINTSSSKRAEDISTLLRKSVGSLPTSLPDTEISVAASMGKWLQDGVAPDPFLIGRECELKSEQEEGGVVSFRKHELQMDEVTSHLGLGKTASKMELQWDDKIQFVLTHEYQLKKLRFMDVLEEQMQDSDPQSHAERLDIEFALMTGEVSNLLNDLHRVLG